MPQEKAATTSLAPVRLGAAGAGHRPVVQARQVEELVDRSWKQLALVAAHLHGELLVDSTVIEWAIPDGGVVLVEFFAGIATGLAEVVANGVRVKRYMYVDQDPVAQAAAAHHIRRLTDQYPQLLTLEAIKGYLTTLPADIQLVGPHHLRGLGQGGQKAPLAYVLENVPAGDDRRENVVESRIGRGVPVDAAALGNRAHQLRMQWTNLAQPELVAAAAA
eukprot:SM000026S08863  [mRNA]  locus=s26:99392:100210:- [translate_table: standard]